VPHRHTGLPPEDCGGLWGYADFFVVIRDPKHLEHESARGGGRRGALAARKCRVYYCLSPLAPLVSPQLHQERFYQDFLGSLLLCRRGVVSA